MSKHHEIKTIQPYFESVWNKDKTYEVRLNDRDYQCGDSVTQREYNPVTKEFSGREVYGAITHVLTNYPALKDGYCVFAFSPISFTDNKTS